jgi:hypothetical protein
MRQVVIAEPMLRNQVGWVAQMQMRVGAWRLHVLVLFDLI